MDIEVRSELGINGRPANVINMSELPTDGIMRDPSMREVAYQMSRWVDNARAANGRTGMFDRGAFTPPENPYDEMRAGKLALKYDSVVAGVAESTEALAFEGIKWESTEPDEADIFNQLARDQNLDGVIRAMWREEFAMAQCVVAKMWGYHDYQVRGVTKTGNKRRASYRIYAPMQLRVLDSLKVVPVNHGPLGGNDLAWMATRGEIGDYNAAYMGETIDPLMLQFFQGTWIPHEEEKIALTQLGVNPEALLMMNPDWVFRHTLTKSDYERFAEVRLKSCFALLDLKRQLMQSDRVTLIGAANYILLIKKGSDVAPAQAEELANLKANYSFIAKLPVIISDHRLDIEIIAPKQDFVLQGDKYDVLDSRIFTRLFGTLSIAGKGQRNETQETLSTVIGKVLGNRRHMLARTLEKEVARAVVDHPRNAGIFKGEPNLVFTPRNVSLDTNDAYSSLMATLRSQREISRETILEYMGLDQTVEAQRMQVEADYFDEIFKTSIPFSSPATQPGADANQPGDVPGVAAPPEPPAVSGARGGRPVGGGKTPQSPAAQTAPKSASGNKTPKKAGS